MSPHDFFDEGWLRNLHGSIFDQGQKYQKNCPTSLDENYLLLIFPVRQTPGRRQYRGVSVSAPFYQGDVLYDFTLEETDDWIVGYHPLTCAKVELPKQDVRLLELINFSFGVRKKEELRNLFIRRVRVTDGSAENRYRCGIKTTVTIDETEAKEITRALAINLGLQFESIYSQIGIRLDETKIWNKLQRQEREFEGDFSIHRVFYLLGDGSQLEVLENWKKCSDSSEDGGEANLRYFVYLAEGSQELVLDKASADRIGVEVSAPTGTWIMRSEEDYWAIRDFLQRDHNLNEHNVHFLMRSMMDWRE